MSEGTTEQLFGAGVSIPESPQPDASEADFPEPDTTEQSDTADSANKYALRPLSPSSMSHEWLPGN